MSQYYVFLDTEKNAFLSENTSFPKEIEYTKKGHSAYNAGSIMDAARLLHQISHDFNLPELRDRLRIIHVHENEMKYIGEIFR